MRDQPCQELRDAEAERMGERLTLPDRLHLWLQQDLLFKVDDLALISVYDLKGRIDD